MAHIPVTPWPLPWHDPRPSGVDVEGAIVHSMGEYIKDGNTSYYCVSWLDKLKYSAHGFITPNGHWIRSVSTGRCARHAGVSRFGDLTGLNKTFLGVEFLVPGFHDYASFKEAIKTDCYTEDQYKSGGMLYAMYSVMYPKITKDTIVAHSVVSGDDVRGPGKGKIDPGGGFNWEKFWGYYDYYKDLPEWNS